MSGYDSSIGGKQFRNTGMREFTVPDGDMDESELAALEQQVKEARRLAAQGKEKISPAGKKRIEMLCGISTLSREVSIDGNIYVLRSLKHKQLKEATMEASKMDGTVGLPFEIRRQLLARSLVSVGGVDIGDLAGDNSIESRLSVIDDHDAAVIERLFKEYSLLVNEIESKYSIKTQADVKEVVEDLKK